VLVLTSVIGLYYYLRVISTLFAESPVALPKEKILHPFFYVVTYTALTLLAGILLGVGIFPGVVIQTIKDFLLIG
jgi:NADH-quinone oxidoreductase subunit N